MPIQFNQKQLLTAILLIGILVLVVRFFGHLSFPESDYNFLGKDRRVKLNPGHTITQVFQAKHDGLNQVKIALGNIGKLPPGEKISLFLKDPACKQIFASETISWLSEEPKIAHRFRFPRVPNSGRQSYCLAITYHAEKKRGDERPYLAASDDTTFSDRSYTDTSDGETHAGRTLQIRPSYEKETLFQNFRELENRLSQYKPAFIKGWVLIIGTIAITLSIFFGILVIRSKDS